MTPAKSLADLLLEWEEQSESGKTVALEELCKNTPELLAPLQARVAELPPGSPIKRP